jgi:hypothetical protein
MFSSNWILPGPIYLLSKSTRRLKVGCSFPVGVFTVGRPRPAIDASGRTWAVRTRRHRHKRTLTGIAKDNSSLNVPMFLG